MHKLYWLNVALFEFRLRNWITCIQLQCIDASDITIQQQQQKWQWFGNRTGPFHYSTKKKKKKVKYQFIAEKLAFWTSSSVFLVRLILIEISFWADTNKANSNEKKTNNYLFLLSNNAWKESEPLVFSYLENVFLCSVLMNGSGRMTWNDQPWP